MAEPVQGASPLFVPISQSDRPEGAITVTGDVAFARQVSQDSVRTQWRIHLKLTNISDEPILAYQIAVEAMPDVGLGVTHLEDNDLSLSAMPLSGAQRYGAILVLRQSLWREPAAPPLGKRSPGPQCVL